jgi:hypothetical protein
MEFSSYGLTVLLLFKSILEKHCFELTLTEIAESFIMAKFIVICNLCFISVNLSMF